MYQILEWKRWAKTMIMIHLLKLITNYKLQTITNKLIIIKIY
jgi:hypothetical protein